MAKEKSIVELLDEKQTIVARHSQITEAAKAEERKLTSAETAELGKAELRLHEINREIAKREQSLSGQGTPMQPTRQAITIRGRRMFTTAVSICSVQVL